MYVANASDACIHDAFHRNARQDGDSKAEDLWDSFGWSKAGNIEK